MVEVTGEIKSVSIDWETNKPIVSIQVNEKQAFIDAHSTLINKQIAIKLGEIRKKRSLDSNAYAWLLIGQIANINNTSKEEVYELMLDRYGTYQQDDEGYIVATFPKKVDVKSLPGHWKYYRKSPDGKFISYLMIKGSSDYNTKEMSTFIDGVVSEAKELGIQTMTPNEIKQMKERWNV